MKVTNLRLRNIRSYNEESVEFPEGTLLVHGDNGAGKTTLLMSIFGGLFLSKIRNVGSNDFKLDDIVRRGEREGEIELTFEVEGTPYTVTWTIDTEGSNSATLESPALEAPVSGIRNVRSEVVDIVGMNEDSFSSSVYVQQGEVDRLFDDDARAELIDDLLGLDRIDRYRLRMKGARRAAGRLITANEQAAENHRETIDEEFDYDVEGYESEIADIEGEISGTESELAEVEDYLEQLNDAKNDLESTIEQHDELVEKLEVAESKCDDLRDDRADEHRSIENAEKAIEKAESEVDALEAEINERVTAIGELETYNTADPIDVDLSGKDAAKQTLNAAQDVVETTKVAKTDAKSTLEQAEDERDRLVDERDELVDETEELSETLDDLEREIEDVQSKVDAAQDELAGTTEERNESTELFLTSDLCPDTVEDSTRVVVESQVDDLTTEKNDLEQQQAGKEASLEAAERRAAEITEDVTTGESEIEDLEDQIEGVEADLESARNELKNAQTELEEDVESLENDLEEFDLSVSVDTLQSLIDDQIPDTKAEIQAAIEEANNRVTELAMRESTLEDDRKKMADLDGVATCPKCGQDVESEHVENELRDIEIELDELEEQLAEAKTERDDLMDHRDDLEALRKQALDLRSFREGTVDAEAERVDDLSDELEELEGELEKAKETLSEAKQEHEDAESTVTEIRAEIDELESDIADLESEIEEGENVLEAFDRVEELRDDLESHESEAEDLQSEQDDIEEEITETETAIEGLKEQIGTQRETVDEAESALETAKNAVAIAEKQRELVSDAVDAYDAIDDLETDIETQRQKISHAQDTIENLNGQIADTEDEIEELESDLGEMDIEEAREKLEGVEERIAKREETVADLEDEVQSLREDRGVLENNLEKLQRFHERLAIAEEKREWAQARHDECDRMLSVYQSAKSDLREQYLGYVNEYTNDIFSDIYKNSSYQQVRILEEGPDGTPYAIQLLRDDGTLEHPSNASGGERAIVNLALRAGIYKLIAEMREGNSGRLPPLILDEPTTFLDAGHVGRLEDMLDSISKWDVPQVIVVSHDERLIQGAEHEMVVSIDEETNASRVDLKRGSRIMGDD